MKLKEVRLQKGLQQKDVAKAIGTDEPMMSKFENYKCLPIPPMLRLLLKVLDCEIRDLYEPNEIYAQLVSAPMRKRKRRSDVYRLTAELPEEARAFLNGGALQELGFKDITAWVNDCYEQLKKAHKAQKEKTSSSLDSER